MPRMLTRFTRTAAGLLVAILLAVRTPTATVQADDANAARHVYDEVKAFSLAGGSAEVTDFVLKRDRAEMTFTGTFYFDRTSSRRCCGSATTHPP